MSAPPFFRLLLALFPREFREAFGDAMCDLFVDQWRAARASTNRGAIPKLWARTIIGMTSAAWRERRAGAARSLRLGPAFQLSDLRYAARRLAAAPTFTATAVATLALCMGANLTIFAVVDSILLRPLPFPDAGRLVTIFNRYPRAGVMDDGASITNYYERRGRIAAFSSLALYRDDGVIVGETGTTERDFVMRVTPDFFATLGVTPMLGRVFREEEATIGADHVVLLSEPYWRQLFDGNPGAVGRTLRINGAPYTIVGVLPAGFSFLSSKARLFLPLSSRAGDREAAWRHSGNSSHMIARLAPGVTVADAQAQIDAHNSAVAVGDPEAAMIAATGFRSVVVPLHASHVASVRPALLLLQAGAAVLLLIGLANIANLFFIRAGSRAKELAVRRAIGARTSHIVSAVMAETLLLGVAGGAAGLVVARAGIDLIGTLGASRLPLGSHIAMDARTGVVALGAALAVAMGLGAAIAWHHIRADSGDALRSETRGGTTTRHAQRLRHAFLVAQIALSFVLLSGSMLLALSLRALTSVSPGFRPEQVLSGQVSLPWTRYDSELRRLSFIDRLMTELQHAPGVAAAGVSTNVPLSGNTIKSAATILGQPPRGGESPRGVYSYGIAGDYFVTMGIPLREGRFLSPADVRPGSRVCVVDEDFVQRYWPQGGAIGHRLFAGSREGDPGDAYTIVGVVGSVRQASLSESDRVGAVYYPYSERFDSAVFVVTRATLSAESVQSDLRRIVRGIDPELPVNNLRTMDTRVADSLVTRRSPALFAAVFSTIALLLAAIGTYGVLSYAVSGRRREIGIRVALGARPEEIRRQFVAIAIRILATGTAVGIAGAWVAGRGMRGLLFGVPPASIPGFAITTAILSIVCLAACLLPARRAARISPIEALARE
ncbi:MAG TPA: ABC transporter permease [Vicinamibacterales bacterium]|nr:ABC transporter permease [Vicinamibacterales bacterium]